MRTGTTGNRGVIFTGSRTVYLLFADNADLRLTFMPSEHGTSLYQLSCQQQKINDLADTLREWAFSLSPKGAPDPDTIASQMV